MRRAQESAVAHGAQIARGRSEDLVNGAIGLRQDRIQHAAAAQVVRVADEMIGTLLDIVA